jgi:hypothetical protein
MFLERIDETLQLSLFGRRDSAAAISAVRAVVRGLLQVGFLGEKREKRFLDRFARVYSNVFC